MIPTFLTSDRDFQRLIVRDCAHIPQAPWPHAFVAQFIGSARRDCLDHVIVFNEAGLQRLMTVYRSYYEQSRT